MIYSCSFVFYFLQIKQHINVEDISSPSVVTSESSSYTTPAKLKLNPVSKISPMPPLINHTHSNNKLIPSKLRNSVDPVKPNLPHKFVIKNIFNNANIDKETFRKPPCFPPLKYPPIPNSTQPNPVAISPDTPSEIPKSPFPDNYNDAMILQIPIEFYQNPPFTPKSNPIEPYLQNGYDSPTPLDQDPSLLKKRPQPPTSPNFIISPKKHTPNTPPTPTNRFNHTDMSPVNGNGDTQLVNGEASNFNWNDIEQITSEKKESIKQLTSPNNLDVMSPINNLKANYIQKCEFPLVSISFSPQIPKNPEINSNLSTEDYTTLHKPLSPSVDVTADNQISTPGEAESPIGGKKIKKSQKEKPNSMPTCQWQGCSRYFTIFKLVCGHLVYSYSPRGMIFHLLISLSSTAL